MPIFQELPYCGKIWIFPRLLQSLYTVFVDLMGCGNQVVSGSAEESRISSEPQRREGTSVGDKIVRYMLDLLRKKSFKVGTETFKNGQDLTELFDDRLYDELI